LGFEVGFEESLSTETEIKIKINDPSGFCFRINALEANTVSDRHFEDNYLLDFPDKRLQLNRCLLRIRFAEELGVLTYKGPPREEGIFKTREELETRLENGATTLQILERIGMRVCFRYQKYRRELALGGVHVAVDETPIGNYVEFEGPEKNILDLARKLGIAESQFLRSSYYSLYQEYCQRKGIAPGFMVF
jgi:adenylate cyclase class 2